MSAKANPKTVGIFVVGAMVLAAASIILFGSGQMFAKTYPFMIFFEGAVGGLTVGAPVSYRGVDVGVVTEVNISISTQNFGDVRMPVAIQINERQVRRHTQEPARLGNPAFVDSMIDAGFRATLATRSLVTGQKYVALDLYPDALPPGEYPESPYPVIPTHVTGMEELQAEITAFVDRLADVDPAALLEAVTDVVADLDTVVTALPTMLAGVPATIETLNETLLAIQQVAERLDSDIGPMQREMRETIASMGETLKSAESTFASMRAVIDPDSPLIVQLERALANMSEASIATARLVDYLDRNPSSLIRGKKGN